MPLPDAPLFDAQAAPTPSAVPPPAAFVNLLRQLVLTGAVICFGWLAAQAGPAPTFWPPAGMALAALYFWGPSMSAALMLGGTLLARLLGDAWLPAIEQGLTLWLAPALSLSLMRQGNWQRGERPVRDLALLLGLGVGLNALMSTSAAWLLMGPQRLLNPLADLLGVLLLSAPLLALEGIYRPQRIAALWLPLPALMALPALRVPGLEPLLCLPLLLILALALRGQAWLAAGSTLLLAVLASTLSALGLGPFASTATSMTGLVRLVSLLAGTALIAPMVSAMLMRRDERNRRWMQALRNEGTALAEWTARGGMRPSGNWEAVTTEALPPDSDPVLWLAVAHPLDRERVGTVLQQALEPGGDELCHEPLRLPAPERGLAPVHGTGAWRWHALRLHVLKRDREGRAIEALLLLSDINILRQAEERQLLAAGLFQHLHEGLLVVDGQHRIVDVNPSYCRIMGTRRETLLGRPSELLQPTTLHRSGTSTEKLMAALHEDGVWTGELRAERSNGTACTLSASICEVRQPRTPGAQRYRIITLTDVTEAHSQRKWLEQHARIDSLTGLANHEEFARQLKQDVATAEREGFMLCVCRVDLDQFKRVNAAFGVDVGDQLLLQVAERLKAALRHARQWSDRIARLGGDEFGLVLRVADMSEAQQALERLLNVVRAPCRLPAPHNGEDLDLTASIGATLFPADPSDAETLLRNAGHALYRVKQHAGRDAFRFFDAAKRQRDEAGLLQIARLQQALDADELLLHYQPKIDMRSGRVLGMEALLRWQHPEQGLLLPGAFLPQIEDTGLALQVGDWIIDQALKQSAQWLAEGLGLEIAVNVTARQLQSIDFAQRLQELVQRHPEPVARHLCLEVLESAALADMVATNALIARCQAFGVRFALDDFGTGYSTLTYLKSLPIDVLKIDRSFVQNMLIDAQDMALIEGVVGLARHFSCSVVAEGVESAAHARALLRLGCQQGQGNGIASAMPAAEVAPWCAAFSRSPWLKQLDPARRGETVN